MAEGFKGTIDVDIRDSTPDWEPYMQPVDLVDKAIEFVKDAKMVAPEKPFFMYFCPGATHAPHHAPKEWIERYAAGSAGSSSG